MKKQLTVSIIAVAMLLLFITGAAFAWLLKGEFITGFFFRMDSFDSEITLYKAKDSNFNGIPDLNAEGKYSYYDGVMQHARSFESPSVVLKMEIEDFLPTQIYTFKISVKNKSEFDNKLSFVFEDTGGFSEYLKVISVRGAKLNNQQIVRGDKIFLAHKTADGEVDFSLFENSELDDIIISAYGKPDDFLEFWVQIEFETHEVLTNNQIIITQNQYQAAQAKTFSLPLLRVYLNIEQENA